MRRALPGASLVALSAPAPAPGDERSRHERLTELFHRAAALEAAARDDLLTTLEREDPSLRAELEELLAADDEEEGWIDDAVRPLPSSSPRHRAARATASATTKSRA